MSFLKGRERMIMALVAGIIFMLFQAFLPQFKFTEEQSLMVVGLLGSYIIGEGISSQDWEFKFKELISSHKFQALIAGLVLVILKGFFPDLAITEDQLINFVALLGTFIVTAGAKS